MEENDPTPQSHKPSKALLVAIVAIAIILFASIVVIMVTYTSKAPTTSQDEQTGTTNSSQDTANDSGTTSSETATITFTDDGFSPTTLTVKKGTKVTVVNNSSSEVQFSSDDHPTHREDPEINMDVLRPGESGSFTATTVGTHGFHDHIDDSKTGTLIVTE